MDNQNVIQYSDSLKREADSIVQEANITNFFSSIGSVVYVGSYRLNLLFRRDIDLFVITDNCTKEKANEVTKKIVDSSKFQTIGFADWTNYESPNTLKGYYWKLEYVYNKNKWKFDVWYTSEEKIVTIERTQKILTLLKQNPQAREQILKLKQSLCNGDTYKDNMCGFNIYERVLGKIE